MHSVCSAAAWHVTGNYIKILSIAQQCFYGKVMSLATSQIIHTSFQKKLYSINLHSSSHTLDKNVALKRNKKKNVHFLMASSDTLTHTHSQALQPMQGLGWIKKSPPIISVLGLDPPISDSQPLCIPQHSVHPSVVWPSHLPSALRLVQGDFLAWYIILHSYWLS